MAGPVYVKNSSGTSSSEELCSGYEYVPVITDDFAREDLTAEYWNRMDGDAATAITTLNGEQVLSVQSSGSNAGVVAKEPYLTGKLQFDFCFPTVQDKLCITE